MENITTTSPRVFGRIHLVTVGREIIAVPTTGRCAAALKSGRKCGAYFRKDGGGCSNKHHHAS